MEELFSLKPNEVLYPPILLCTSPDLEVVSQEDGIPAW